MIHYWSLMIDYGGRWNDGVAIKPERQATESVRVVTNRSPQAFQKIAKGRNNSQESFWCLGVPLGALQETFGRPLGCLWEAFGSPLGGFGRPLGARWEALRRFWHSKKPQEALKRPQKSPKKLPRGAQDLSEGTFDDPFWFISAKKKRWKKHILCGTPFQCILHWILKLFGTIFGVLREVFLFSLWCEKSCILC